MKYRIYHGLAIFLVMLAMNMHGTEIVFQKGLNGYNGVHDTTIRADPARVETANYAHSDTLMVSGVPWGGAKAMALIRFDRIIGAGPFQIPTSAIIDSARLELHKLDDTPGNTGQYEEEGNHAVVVAYPMKTHFEFGSSNGDTETNAVCFAYRAFHPDLPVYWGDKNQDEKGPVRDVDYDASSRLTAICRMCPDEKDVWMTWDITKMVKDWMERPESNQGVFLVTCGYWIGAKFSSSESVHQENRPRLVVEFTVPKK